MRSVIGAKLCAVPDIRAALKREAHKRIDEGHLVIPLRPNGKTPIWKGWQERATTDHRVVDRDWPDGCNIGSVTKTKLVVDCDDKNGLMGSWVFANWRVEHGLPQVPDTLLVTTWSGGTHVYFERPPDLILGNSPGTLPPGIDVRGRGGFVVAEGSVINGVSYRRHRNSADYIAPIPAELIAALTPKPAERPQTPVRVVGTAYGDRALDGECEAIEQLSTGNRHNGLLSSAVKIGSLIGAGALHNREYIEARLLDAVRHQSDPYPEASARRDIADGIDYGMDHPRLLTSVRLSGDMGL